MRLNYILWVEDLIGIQNSKNIVYKGMDLGCGPYCIFASIFVRMQSKIDFLCFDIDDENIKLAQTNILKNNLVDNIIIEKEINSKFIKFFECLDDLIIKHKNSDKTKTVYKIFL